jgi:hypothetical protein
VRTPPGCPREADVVDLVAVGLWPVKADADLRSHVADCAVCAEVATVAAALADLRDVAAVPVLPDASVVWTRARLQASQDAARRASRPLVVAHALAIAVLLGVGLAWWTDATSWVSTSFAAITGVLSARPQVPAPPVPDLELGALGPVWWVIGGAVIGWLLLVPVVLGIARLTDDDPAESLTHTSRE